MTTFANEPNLERLPVPSLESTAEQLLSALRPLIPASNYNKLLNDSIKFLNSKNVKFLQKHLLKSYDENDCYLDGKGISLATPGIYGELFGKTLPRNPFFILEDDPLTGTSQSPTQTFRAAVLVTSTLRFICSLRKESISPDFTPNSSKPLTMTNYKKLFGTSRIPILKENGNGSNDIGVGLHKNPNSKNIIILSSGQFYSLQVLNEKNELFFTKHELAEIFDSIIQDSESLNLLDINKIAIGSISTESKNSWRQARLRLEETNSNYLKLIDDALFVLCLDSTCPKTDNEKIECISHGLSRLDKHNFQVGTCLNRWYDKLQIVVSKNSVAGCIWESTSCDATSVLRFFTDIYTDSVLRVARKINGLNFTMWSQINTVDVGSEKPTFTKLNFQLPVDLFKSLHLAETRLADLISQHEYYSLTVSKFGKNFIINKLKLPADSLMQLVFQISYFALYGKLCVTNELISTRRFKNSRTELISVQSEAVLQCCQSFINSSTLSQKWSDLKAACYEHSSKVKKASHGHGFERHLSALRSAYQQRNILNSIGGNELPQIEEVEPPLIFDPSVDLIYNTEILIANCGNPALHLFGVTPAITNGFGIGYIIKENQVQIVASSQWRQTERFLKTVESVITRIKHYSREIYAAEGHITSSKIGGSRARELEFESYTRSPLKHSNGSIIQSLPMELIKSNNSAFNNSSSKSVDNDTNFILGGYDYFDVHALASRSNNMTRANSGFQSREYSSTNITDIYRLEDESRDNVLRRREFIDHNGSIGRKVELKEDD
ncbi:hypothetical protein PACTADRAFT_52115 [Pachysolen tannophilus NRRL Y-2460]|uniref:Choline/carnitine acyltransferase domain-containing protein n=1 Tax=Pachysolen tannophilus NRRL Y-2460 TaxID=669874 RepID=A0A1E4TP72_PACTA|nr:hypothetical protein PACTADRAFT_52115 [Pachysolen tannophilus NRRL Y-2460]